MRVLGIAGSPRKNGNTDMMLAEFMRGAENRGAETKTIFLRELKYNTCIHCDGCLKDGNCVVKDEMQQIYPEMEKADIIVMASPIQFMGVTAPMKAMIDRCQALWARKYVLKIPPLGDRRKRKGFFISVGGRKISNLFEPSLVMMKTYFRIIDIEYAGELIYKGIDEKGAVLSHPDALKQAFSAGQRIVDDLTQERENSPAPS